MDNKQPNFLWDYIFTSKDNNKKFDLFSFLKEIPFFEGLTNRQLKSLSLMIHERHYQENEFLFEYGHPGAALFIIVKGDVSIEVPTDEGMTQVTNLTEKTFLGELALITNEPRTASARALVPTKSLALFRNDLAELVNSEPEIASHIYKSLSQIVGKRLIETTKMINKLKKRNENHELKKSA
ncbi:MAG: cyclic nucleotide-binding domain-containing protein [Bdellovibrionales bacterium]|nr:cyclic nucleotide-binding domain-containing protein [Bdellovibrionales bacterium]